MKQYGIYIRCGNAQPYMIHFYNTIDAAKLKLYDIISLEEERGRPYFVDNDFYSNKYSVNMNGKYFCIKERDVTDFIKYSENNITKEKNNILYLDNFLKYNNKSIDR